MNFGEAVFLIFMAITVLAAIGWVVYDALAKDNEDDK